MTQHDQKGGGNLAWHTVVSAIDKCLLGGSVRVFSMGLSLVHIFFGGCGSLWTSQKDPYTTLYLPLLPWKYGQVQHTYSM